MIVLGFERVNGSTMSGDESGRPAHWHDPVDLGRGRGTTTERADTGHYPKNVLVSRTSWTCVLRCVIVGPSFMRKQLFIELFNRCGCNMRIARQIVRGIEFYRT